MAFMEIVERIMIIIAMNLFCFIIAGDMTYKSKNFPENKHKFYVMQEYAAPMYTRFLIVLMVIIFYQMSIKGPLFNVGVFGSMAAVIIAQFAAVVKMRNTVVELSITDGSYSVRSAYDVAFDKLVPMVPLALSNAKKEGNKITIQYDQRAISLTRSDWNDIDDILAEMQ